MSVPPDQFDSDNEDEIPDDDEEQLVVWEGRGNPPDWFYNAAEILAELDNRDSVFLEIDGGLGAVEKHDDGTYSLVLHGYDEDSGEDLYWSMDDWDYESLMDFYNYIEDNYDDVAFWAENYSIAQL